MADALVERITATPATPAATPASIALNIVISDRALLGGENDAALVEGYGPIPAEVARRWLTTAAADQKSLVTLRRLYASPTTGALVAMKSRADLPARAGPNSSPCATKPAAPPYCVAPIRHRDHITPVHRGGPTTAANGEGLCERCNYVKESPGWRVSAHDNNGTHTTEHVTPPEGTTNPPHLRSTHAPTSA